MGSCSLDGPGRVGSCSLDCPGMVGSCSLDGPPTVGSCSLDGPVTVVSCSLDGPRTVGSCSLDCPGMVGSCSLDGPVTVVSCSLDGPRTVGSCSLDCPVLSHVLAGSLTFGSYFVQQTPVELLFTCIYQAMCCLSIACSHCLAVEIFPTSCRATGVALVLGFSQLGVILGDLALVLQLNISCVFLETILALLIIGGACRHGVGGSWGVEVGCGDGVDGGNVCGDSCRYTVVQRNAISEFLEYSVVDQHMTIDWATNIQTT
uniref:Uncharacterized protein n=1 Tax=Timema shepardi TaxID=629360 RepID=A0A7R9G5D4_TIMSH|nr:unnamed protein product [Timema shepardi]